MGRKLPLTADEQLAKLEQLKKEGREQHRVPNDRPTLEITPDIDSAFIRDAVFNDPAVLAEFDIWFECQAVACKNAINVRNPEAFKAAYRVCSNCAPRLDRLQSTIPINLPAPWSYTRNFLADGSMHGSWTR